MPRGHFLRRAQDWADSSASKAHIMQAKGPEFGPQDPCKANVVGGMSS